IEVRITRPFDIGATEVTQLQWEAVMGTRPWEGRAWAQNDHHAPATYVSWHDAAEFCARLSAAGEAEYALPAEAQWLLACYAGREDGDLWWFAQEDATDFAWLRPNTEGAGESWPHTVGTLAPNDFGIHDMPGNVLEWTADAYDWWTWRPERSEPVKVDPALPPDGDGLRVICGGSLYYTPRQLLIYPTRERYATRRTFDTGFRVIRTIP
ncbi:MAG: formylglycine-generating enzyme family protein, partial [Armatimonadota bacterium]